MGVRLALRCTGLEALVATFIVASGLVYPLELYRVYEFIIKI